LPSKRRGADGLGRRRCGAGCWLRRAACRPDRPAWPRGAVWPDLPREGNRPAADSALGQPTSSRHEPGLMNKAAGRRHGWSGTVCLLAQLRPQFRRVVPMPALLLVAGRRPGPADPRWLQRRPWRTETQDRSPPDAAPAAARPAATTSSPPLRGSPACGAKSGSTCAASPSARDSSRRPSATGPRARIADPAGDQNQARAAGADPPRTPASRTTICRQPARE
jgi:hypothetical protein